jgi:hypothetical protein
MEERRNNVISLYNKDPDSEFVLRELRQFKHNVAEFRLVEVMLRKRNDSMNDFLSEEVRTLRFAIENLKLLATGYDEAISLLLEYKVKS